MTGVSLVDYETATVWIARLLAEAATERVDIAAFTDEELAALDGDRAEHVAPTPWLDALPAEQHELAASIALRGLIARGLVVRLDEHQEGDRTVLSMPDEVLAVLAMRRTAASITIAGQQTSLGQRTRVLYRHADGLLEENVSTGGLHTFSLAPLPVAADGLAAWCDPQHVAGDDGETSTIALADVARGEGIPSPLTASLVVTVLAGVGPEIDDDGDPVQTRVTVYATPDQVHVADPAPEPGHLRIREVSASSLRSAVEAVVAGHHA
ncbi:MAG: hypothetical protein QG622_2787 [Actinomycetota bacterium]|nr:hypothetical protein [Actinomycetota bacterium]